MSDEIEEVFVLGAGFSKAIIPNMPTLSELTRQIEAVFNEKPDDDILKKIFFNINPSLRNNFEQLLTFLITSKPWLESENNLHQALFREITDSISTLISRGKDEIDFPKFGKLIQYLVESKSKIINFNYDLILEYLIELHFNRYVDFYCF